MAFFSFPGAEVRSHHTGEVQATSPQHRGSIRERRRQARLQQTSG